jgi:hypothetical protein
MGKKLACGAYDKWWVARNVRTFLFETYKQSCPDSVLDKIFEIIKQGE